MGTTKKGFLLRLKKYGNSALVGFIIGIMLPFAVGIIAGNFYSGFKYQEYKTYPRWLKYIYQNNSMKAPANLSDNSQNPYPLNSQSEKDSLPFEFLEAPQINSSRFTVLLVGVDNRPGEGYISNTDTLVVASIDKNAGRISLLSVPRDTQVTIPGRGIDKINSAARIGKGINTTKFVLEQLLGERLDGYVITNFNGFKQVVDIIGGITLNVEKDMYYNTGDGRDGIINLKKGNQRLNGSKALQYARFRNDSLADISRTARQQTVIKAIAKEVIQLKNIPKLPVLISQVYSNIETDLTVNQLWSLAKILITDKEIQIISQTLPGYFSIEKGISYWKVNPKESRVVTKKLFLEGKTTSTFSGLNTNQDQHSTGGINTKEKE